VADVAIVEPDGIVRGHDALNERIGRLQDHLSGDLIDQAVMFVPGFDELDVPSHG
jgi:hypothetical protein